MEKSSSLVEDSTFPGLGLEPVVGLLKLFGCPLSGVTIASGAPQCFYVIYCKIGSNRAACSELSVRFPTINYKCDLTTLYPR